MTTDRIDIAADSSDVRAELDRIGGDSKPLLRSIGRSVHTRIMLGFKAGRAPDGTAWKALKFRNGQPLRDTRALQSSIVANPPSGDHVDIGTNKLQARLMHFGGTVVPKAARWNERERKSLVFMAGGRLIFARKVVIPSRKYMPVNASGQIDIPASWQPSMMAIIKRHVEGTAPKAGE